jgi:hypothetical protein
MIALIWTGFAAFLGAVLIATFFRAGLPLVEDVFEAVLVTVFPEADLLLVDDIFFGCTFVAVNFLTAFTTFFTVVTAFFTAVFFTGVFFFFVSAIRSSFV